MVLEQWEDLKAEINVPSLILPLGLACLIKVVPLLRFLLGGQRTKALRDQRRP